MSAFQRNGESGTRGGPPRARNCATRMARNRNAANPAEGIKAKLICSETYKGNLSYNRNTSGIAVAKSDSPGATISTCKSAEYLNFHTRDTTPGRREWDIKKGRKNYTRFAADKMMNARKMIPRDTALRVRVLRYWRIWRKSGNWWNARGTQTRFAATPNDASRARAYTVINSRYRTVPLELVSPCARFGSVRRTCCERALTPHFASVIANNL